MERPATQQHEHPIRHAVAVVSGALDEVAAVDPLYMSPDQLRTGLPDILREANRLAELSLRMLAAADTHHIGDADGSPTTAAWLGHHTQTDRAEAHALVVLSRRLEHRPATRAAFAAGDISLEQARVIVQALDRLPNDLPAETLDAGEQALLAEAKIHDPKALRRLGRRLLEVIAPEIAEDQLHRQVRADEAAAWAKTRLTLHDNPDGTTDGWFTLPTLNAHMLKAALEALTAPRKHNQTQHGPDHLEPAPGSGSGSHHLTELRPDPATRRGHAFAQLLEHLPVDKLGHHGATTATVVVTITLDQLTEELTDSGALGLPGLATLDDDTPLTAATARKLACEAGIIPLVLGGPTVIADRGRTQRLFTHQQRISLNLRDKHCRAEGCTTPAAWTEAHHLTPWSRGGNTDLTHGILLCGHHHRLIHSPDYDHRHHPATNTVTFQRRHRARR